MAIVPSSDAQLSLLERFVGQWDESARARWPLACVLLEHGMDPLGPEVATALGLDEQSQAARVELESLRRRAKRHKGTPKPGTSLEQRKEHVAGRILIAWFGCLLRRAVTPWVAELELISDARDLEAHPNGLPQRLEVRATAQLVERVDELETGELKGPVFSDKPLGTSQASHRNRKRLASAHAARLAALGRLAAQVGHRVTNPGGVVPLPLAEGRRARRLVLERGAVLMFLRELPPVVRTALVVAVTRGTGQGLFAQASLHRIAFFAFLWWQAVGARPSMRRDGYDRAIEGLPRESLAVSFAWHSRTERPFHANTLSLWVAELERAGLLMREHPNQQRDVYRGPSGWALCIYRMRTERVLHELYRAAGFELPELAPSMPDPAPS
jgi:hypothetical protein